MGEKWKTIEWGRIEGWSPARRRARRRAGRHGWKETLAIDVFSNGIWYWISASKAGKENEKMKRRNPKTEGTNLKK